MSGDFYDKVAKKFGEYRTGVEIVREYPNGDPDAVFKQKLFEVSGADKVVLDLGCADGRFTISIAPNFKEIYALDMSDGMLSSAKEKLEESGLKNVHFQKMDADHTEFENAFFDAVYSRRGPTPYPEIARVLKQDGYFLNIEIGEKDCQEIKEVFRRGQGFGDWQRPYLPLEIQKIEKSGLYVTFNEDYLYNEYYQSYEDLNIFLQGVPIFEDYDEKKDKDNLIKYVESHTSEKGVILPRHRLVIVAKK